MQDYKGNIYSAEIVNAAVDPDYDLACLIVFIDNSEECEVEALSFAQENPSVADDVILLGTPDGQTNSILYGNVLEYKRVVLSNTSSYESNVTFNVICTNARLSGGSSGGPLLDANLNVIGVHYAGNSLYQYGYAIPLEKIIEFLAKYGINWYNQV